MVNTLLVIILVLVILLVIITILFHRQGMRFSEEIKNAIDSVDVKSHYLADTSQTFRGPVNAIIKRCEAIESQPDFKEHTTILEAIEDIHFQSKQLLQYTDEILEMSNTAGNIPHSSKIEVNLIELILSYRREILYDVKKDIPVNVQTEMSPHTKVWLDTTMFRQLIMHILRTAAQHTDHGYITIRYAAENNGLRFWIENISQPIPQEALDTMFTKQIAPTADKDQSNEKEIAVTMSICKAIIDNMNGTIEAKGQDTEQGYLNIITYWFPCTLNIE